MAKLTDISDDEWLGLNSRLTLYALRKMRRLCWRGARPAERPTAPGGQGPEDLAATAIERVLDGSRAWDASADPFDHLCSVLDSLVSHLVGGWENRNVRGMPTARSDDGPERPVELPGREPDPSHAAAESEEAHQYRAAVRDAVAKDPLAAGIFDCLQAGYSTPADMAELLDVDVEQIYTAKRRLERAVNGVLSKTRKRSPSDKGTRHARHP